MWTPLKIGIVLVSLIGIAVKLDACEKVWEATQPVPPPAEWVRLDHIERIVMHERQHYTFFARGTPDDSFLEPHTIRLYGDCRYRSGRKKHLQPPPELIMTDVPEGEPMWAEWLQRNSVVSVSSGEGCGPRYFECLSGLAIHVHSPQDIVGGGWNHGKDGAGTTTVIE